MMYDRICELESDLISVSQGIMEDTRTGML